MEITSLSKWYRRENGRGKNAFYKISHITSHDAYNQKRGVYVYVWNFHHHDNAISFYVAVWKSFSPLFFTFDCHFLKEFNLMKKKSIKFSTSSTHQINFQRNPFQRKLFKLKTTMNQSCRVSELGSLEVFKSFLKFSTVTKQSEETSTVERKRNVTKVGNRH